MAKRFDQLTESEKNEIRRLFPKVEWHRFFWSKPGSWLPSEYKVMQIVESLTPQAPKPRRD